MAGRIINAWWKRAVTKGEVALQVAGNPAISCCLQV